MAYYLYSLLLSSLLSLCLFVLLVYRLRINSKFKNKHALSYLLPPLLAAAFIYFTVCLTTPRLLDLPTVVTGKLEVREVDISSQQFEEHTIVAEGKSYKFSPYLLEGGQSGSYKITYTPKSRYIIAIEQISSPDSLG